MPKDHVRLADPLQGDRPTVTNAPASNGTWSASRTARLRECTSLPHAKREPAPAQATTVAHLERLDLGPTPTMIPAELYPKGKG